MESLHDKSFHEDSFTGIANTMDDVQRKEEQEQEPQYDVVKVAEMSVNTLKFVQNVAYESCVQTTLVENVAYGNRNEVYPDTSQ